MKKERINTFSSRGEKKKKKLHNTLQQVWFLTLPGQKISMGGGIMVSFILLSWRPCYLALGMFELQSYPWGCPMQYKLGLKLCITFDTCLSGPTRKMCMFKLAWSTQSAISCLLSAVRGQRSSPVAIARDFWTSSYLFFTLLLRKGARAMLQISMGALTEWCLIELGRVYVFALMFHIKGTRLAM